MKISPRLAETLLPGVSESVLSAKFLIFNKRIPHFHYRIPHF